MQMRNFSTILTGLSMLALAFSCKPNKQESFTGQPVTLETRSIQQNKGTDCDKQPDSLRTDCAIVDFLVPNIQGAGAQSALGKNLTAWVDKFLIHLLIYSDYPETNPSKALKSVDAAIKRFHGIHDESEGAASAGHFIATCSSGEMLNDGKYLTVMLDGHSYQGGNHSLKEVAIATFDVKTGKQLTWPDLVNDQKTLLPIAQAKVRETRAEAFSEGFNFDKEEAFALPSSYGLVADGLVMHYQPDEIYQLGGATEFTIPYRELGANLKVAAPALPADDSSSNPSDIYEVQGDSLVIPTFEIEVSNSSKAVKTLKNKKETVIVSAYFAGYPSDKNDRDEEGVMAILNKRIELTGNNRIARFEGLKFSKKTYAKLARDDKDISVLINIFSGRKSSNDNLLSCGLLEMKASKFKDKRLVLGCQLIAEPVKDAMGTPADPLACYALPPGDTAPNAQLSFLVECDESGQILWAGTPMKDYDALMAALRPVMVDLKKNGAEELPGIKTEGCLMGNSGEIRTRYEELKTELSGKGKATAAPAEYTKTDAKKKPQPVTTKPAPAAKKPAAATQTAPTAKPVAAKTSSPAVTLNQKGEITLDGKKVSLENLRKDLQQALLAQAVIPDKLELKTIGETGMGIRGEVRTVIEESITGAKWVRKKTAIEALNSAVGKKLKTSTQLELGTYQLNGSFAYISAKPKQADGKAIDYSNTDYAKDAKSVNFADNTIGLLQYEKGAWKILTYSIGVSKPPVDVWVKNYKAPKALFGETK